MKIEIGNKVWYLNGGKRESGFIIDIFEDEPFDGASYEVKCCYTSNNGGSTKSFHRMSELIEENNCYQLDFRSTPPPTIP